MRDRYTWIPTTPPRQWTDNELDAACVLAASLSVGLLCLAVAAVMHAVGVWP
jgi:hypothetical protein